MTSCNVPEPFAGRANNFTSLKEGLRRFYADTKNVFSPGLDSEASSVSASDELKAAPHPGTEGVSFEEALEKCPHLAQKYKDGKLSTPPSEQQNATPSRCPYQNGASQEWSMRAVVMFVAYNFITLGINIGAVKIGFVIGAYHIGALRAAEFIVLYMTTAMMSSYKLLGLLLMLTKDGGPAVSFDKQYRVGIRNVLSGILIGAITPIVTGVSMHWAISMQYFRQETQTDLVLYSTWQHLVIPIGAEFVYRGFLMKEMGKDLGAWFGVLGSSGWYAILQRGPASVKFGAFMQGLFWSLCTTAFKGDLIPVTVAHVMSATLRVIYPSLYFAVFPVLPL